MDRRTALKKLAASGVIVAGGSMVMSSNSVAQAASCLLAPASPFSITPGSAQNNDQFLVAPNATMVLPNGTPQFGWRIQTYANLGNKRSLLVRQTSSNQTIVIGPNENNCASGCPVPGSGFTPDNLDGAVTFSAVDEKGDPKGFGNNSSETYTIDAKVTWTFTDGCPPLVAVYRFSGAGRSLPPPTKLP